jgi:hypothetical protein
MRRAVTPAAVAIGPGRVLGSSDGTGPSALEVEALGLLLSHPVLAVESGGNGALPFRDATALALASSWQTHLASAGATIGTADLEDFVSGLDPASTELARALLTRLAEAGEDGRLDPEQAREVLRITLLRLRVARLEEDLRDGRLLLEEAQHEGDRSRLEAIEQQIIRLGREKAEVTKAMRTPAEAAGTRRS